MIEQFEREAPEHLAVWLKERKPKSLQQAAEMADDKATARMGEDRSRSRNRSTGEDQPHPLSSSPGSVGIAHRIHNSWQLF